MTLYSSSRFNTVQMLNQLKQLSTLCRIRGIEAESTTWSWIIAIHPQMRVVDIV